MSLKKHAHTQTFPTIPPLVGAGFVLLVILVSGWWIWDTQFARSTDGGLQNCRSISRATYGVSPAIFEELETPPECFHTIVDAYRTGTFTNAFFFDEKYYTQPEFFPSFEKDGLPTWKSPAAKSWGAVGYGAYPYNLNLELLPGQTTRARIFVFTSFGIRTYQGMRFDLQYPNPKDANHISVKVLSDATDGFILGPTFPKFSPLWVHPVDLEITAAKNIPPETLRVNFRVKSPTSKIDEEGVEKYGVNYYPATAYIGERTPAAMSVTILPEDGA